MYAYDPRTVDAACAAAVRPIKVVIRWLVGKRRRTVRAENLSGHMLRDVGLCPLSGRLRDRER